MKFLYIINLLYKKDYLRIPQQFKEVLLEIYL